MGKKSKFLIQEKERIILEFLNNKISSNISEWKMGNRCNRI